MAWPRSLDDLIHKPIPFRSVPGPAGNLLPASAYQLEIVQAARFVKDTNNISKLDIQPWDDNVKAIAKFPDVIHQMNENIAWTRDLDDAFANQPRGVIGAIKTMRAKVYQKDLGPNTAAMVKDMTEYNPDKSWKLSPD